MTTHSDHERDDTRITAYALGELEPQETEEVEDYLESSEDGAREVAEIRALASALEEALAKEPSEGLSPPQRREVLTATRPTKLRRSSRWHPLAVAAAIAGVSAAGWMTWSSQREDNTAPFTYGLGAELAPSAGAPLARRSELEGIGYSGGSSSGNLQDLGYTSAPSQPSRVIGLGGGAGGEYGRRAARTGRVEDELSTLRDAGEAPSTEDYAHVRENAFLSVAQSPLSTFSIDVDTASYANVRRFLNEGRLPPADAVRIEELLNYFRYDYAPPTGGDPFSINIEVASAPWKPEHRLVRIGLQGRAIPVADRQPSNLVFLLDVSGSMNSANKLPLVKKAMRLLIDQLDGRDRVSIAVYAGAAGLVLPPTSCGNRPAILAALENLSAGGSTNGGQGIRLAYDTARAHFVEGGINRVILCTDGDFNVGTSSEGELVRLIEDEARSGVFLSVLGFGTGNLKDSTMEQLADRGNGNYAYIDSLREANKVLVEEMGGTLVTIAKDVKIQIELNPAEVAAYRLIGYENRLLAAEDFNDDRVDAGEIGAGHTVTALYEIVPVGIDTPVRDVDPLKYQAPSETGNASAFGELLMVKLRYKEPDGETSRLIDMPLIDDGLDFESASDDLRFASSVAAFGMLLRESKHSGNATLREVLRWASLALGPDRGGYRAEFLALAGRALGLKRLEDEDQAALDDLGYLEGEER